MTAARNGEFDRPMGLLAPDATVTADQAAALAGTSERIDGRRWVATFFNGSAHAVLSVCVDDGPRPRSSTRGQAKVVFEFTVTDGMVRGITVSRRTGSPRGCRAATGMDDPAESGPSHSPHANRQSIDIRIFARAGRAPTMKTMTCPRAEPASRSTHDLESRST